LHHEAESALSNQKTPAGDQAYVRFLQRSSKLKMPLALAALDPLEERMLAWLAVQSLAGHEHSVRQVMEHREFGAPATIHTRLKSMRRKGWVRLADTEDTRRKRVELTKTAYRHFERLGRAMLDALRS
jgi:DNA-binding MarR family transcriptional regulator